MNIRILGTRGEAAAVVAALRGDSRITVLDVSRPYDTIPGGGEQARVRTYIRAVAANMANCTADGCGHAMPLHEFHPDRKVHTRCRAGGCACRAYQAPDGGEQP